MIYFQTYVRLHFTTVNYSILTKILSPCPPQEILLGGETFLQYTFSNAHFFRVYNALLKSNAIIRQLYVLGSISCQR